MGDLGSYEEREKRKKQRKRIKKIAGIVCIAAGMITIAVLLKKDRKMTVEYFDMVEKNEEMAKLAMRALDAGEKSLDLVEQWLDAIEGLVPEPLVPTKFKPSLAA